MRHLNFSTTARSEIGKSIYCSALLATDDQDPLFLEQEDQGGGFHTF